MFRCFFVLLHFATTVHIFLGFCHLGRKGVGGGVGGGVCGQRLRQHLHLSRILSSGEGGGGGCVCGQRLGATFHLRSTVGQTGKVFITTLAVYFVFIPPPPPRPLPHPLSSGFIHLRHVNRLQTWPQRVSRAERPSEETQLSLLAHCAMYNPAGSQEWSILPCTVLPRRNFLDA